MVQDLPLFPEQASSFAAEVDWIYFALVGVSTFFSVLICALLVTFGVRYRRAKIGPRAVHVAGSLSLELLWTLIPFGIVLAFFAAGAIVFFRTSRPPADALAFSATGKQWMWRIQHPTGQREINEMHVPVNTPIVMTLTSEDVIHSFFIPAFRTKQDVLPGRYSSLWFEPTKVGTYDLFCAEYCGTKHSEMIGRVFVMEPGNYERWLEGTIAGETPVATGERLFATLRCDTCHAAQDGPRGPSLHGRFGTEVALESGDTVTFDAEYVRASIVWPSAQIVRGYEPLMPTYRGQLSEAEILAIAAYLRTLAGAEETR